MESFDELKLTVLDQEDQVSFSNDHVDISNTLDIIEFNDYLGLAIQKIPQTTTIKCIWEESF